MVYDDDYISFDNENKTVTINLDIKHRFLRAAKEISCPVSSHEMHDAIIDVLLIDVARLLIDHLGGNVRISIPEDQKAGRKRLHIHMNYKESTVTAWVTNV